MEDLLNNFTKSFNYRFIIFVILFALLIRFILSIFKAYAHYKGETIDMTKLDEPEEEKIKKAKSKSKRTYISQSFLSNSGTYKIDDHWLPFFIGLFELTFFPLLLQYSLTNTLGAWIAFKALGNWTTKNPRTAINRFLFGNILSIVASIILWKCFLN